MSDPAPSPPPRWLALTLAGVTLVVVAALSLVLFRDDLEPVDDEAAAPEATAEAEGDDFERDDAPTLADADHAWAEGPGAWAVQDRHAAVTDVPADRPALAALQPEAPVTVARVTATAVEPGWAFAFRVQDESNFWALVARPDTASWSLAVVRDGVPTETEGFLAVEPADGDVVEVTLTGTVVRVTVGDVTNQVDDATLAEAAGIGLAAFVPENLASMAWDDVEVGSS